MSENTETFNVLGGQSSTATDSTTDKINITNNYTKRATVNNPVFTTAEENKDEHDASISYNKIYDGSHNSTSNISAFELKMVVDEALSGNKEALPDMWSYDYIGLYCQYAAVGLLYGSAGTVIPFCVYTFDGPSNVCSNGKNVMFFAWSLKIFIAVLTDMYRPFGFRRRPWMMFGWAGTLLCLLILATTANLLPLSLWLTLLMFSQFFLMFSDVPADGYSVELGHMEPLESRGQILATGQRIRFSFSVLAGVLQTFLLNGPATSEDDCDVTFNGCWAWGLTINGYYGLLFAIVFVLTLPVWWLKEIDCTNIPQHNFDHFKTKIWETMQNLTTYYLIVFVIGIQALTGFTSNVNVYLQYYVIKLSNFQAGIDTVTTYLALAGGIWLFQKFLINRNWRFTQYASTLLASCFGLIWIAPYYNSGGTQDPYFTIFIDLDSQFAAGLQQVLYSMAVIELAKPGQEATTYELIVTVGNAALTLNGIIATQLLTPLNAVGCLDDDGCPSDTVNLNDEQSYRDSAGPKRFTNYAIVLFCISVTACFIFTQYLPRSKIECYEWKMKGEELGTSRKRGYLTLFLATVTIAYGVIAAILLLDPSTSCLSAVGGEVFMLAIMCRFCIICYFYQRRYQIN